MSQGPYRGDNPRAREDAEILNYLYFIRGRTEKVEGLVWFLGRKQKFAILGAEPGTSGISFNPMTGDVTLLGYPCVWIEKEDGAGLFKPAEWCA